MLTALALQNEVMGRVGLILVDAELYAVDSTGMVPVIAAGLRKGAGAVGMLLSAPMAFADADAAGLTGFAVERVLDEAERWVLERVILGWYRVVRKYRKPVETTADVGGWLDEQKASIQSRLASLTVSLAQPYREPSDPMVVVNRWSFGGVRGFRSQFLNQVLAPDPLGFPFGYAYGSPWIWESFR